MELIIQIVVIIIVVIILIVVFSGLFQRAVFVADRQTQEIFPPEQIVLTEYNANFFGLQSRGAGQIRGNGVLVLTHNELGFRRFFVRLELSIPLEQIQDVRLVNSHLGKRIVGYKLLWVQFQNSTGLDAVAWLVKNPEQWQMAIESARQNQMS